MREKNYWNRANFEGLASLASALRAHSYLELLAQYCELREKGLRKQAFAALDAFLDQAHSWTEVTRREIVLLVLDAHWTTPEAHQFLADPLHKRLIDPVLAKWRVDEPNNSVPLRQLALLRRDYRLLQDVLRLNQKDDRVRVALAEVLIGFVDYAMHHLVEGKFIGDEVEVRSALSEADAVLKEVTDASLVQALNENVQCLSALLDDWLEYQRAPEGTFPEWCHIRNRNHRWWSIVYPVF